MRERLLMGKRPVLISFLTYTSIALITVISVWVIGLHRYDLSLTISIYVGLRPWTAIVYGICVAFMVVLIFAYIVKSKIPILRKILYFLIFLSVLGCAVFPFNRSWSELAAAIHNNCAYVLMMLTALSFVVLLIAGRRAQKVFAVISLLYAAFFIVAFVVINWQPFLDTIFIWENLFIYLLLGELALE